uniref:Pecanex-like protein n=1 Tax=Macrostomum lignano TaxID=282301 RepID=A0A1I8IK00_9PLAT
MSQRSQLKTSLDFFAMKMYFCVGFFDMFLVPASAYEYGGASFLGLYSIIVLLFGIPAFAEESSYLMVDDSRNRSPKFRKWLLCYEAISLMQITQLAVGEADNKISMALVQFFIIISGRRVTQTMPLYSPKCRLVGSQSAAPAPTVIDIVDNILENAEQQELRLLQPSCLVRDRGEVACMVHALFSDPGSIFFYTMCMMSVLILVYALLFGRSMLNYAAIGRFYIALVVLSIFTLLLHFVGRPKGHAVNESSHREALPNIDKAKNKTLLYCIHSLGLMTFAISVIGSRAGKHAKENFVSVSILACLADTAVSFAFSGLVGLRQAAVEHLCGGNITTRQFSSMPDITRKLLESDEFGFKEMQLRSFLDISESMLMFRETDGSVPWTVYLPFQGLIMCFSILLGFIPFLLADLQAERLFKWRSNQIWLLGLLRFACLTCLQLLSINGYGRFGGLYMSHSVPMVFLVLKIFNCIAIHLDQGFTEFINKRRQLLSGDNKVQLFLFNWYVAPCLLFLYHFGYPAVCFLFIAGYRENIFSLNFFIYFSAFNVLPIVAIVCAIVFIDN